MAETTTLTAKVLLDLDLNADKLKASLISVRGELVKHNILLTEAKQRLKEAFLSGADDATIQRLSTNVVRQENAVKNLTQTVRGYEKEIKLVSTLNNEEEGSYNQTAAAISLYNKELQAQSEVTRTTNEDSIAMQATLKQLQDSYNTGNQALGNYKQNVGNYTSSILAASRGLRAFSMAGYGLAEVLGIDATAFRGAVEGSRILLESTRGVHDVQRAQEATIKASTAATQANTTADVGNATAKKGQTTSETENTTAQKEGAAATVVNTEATEAQTVATEEGTVATNIFSRAWAALQASFLANPFIAIAAAVAILALGVYALVKSTRDANEEQRMLNEINDKAAETYTKEVIEIRQTIAALGDLKVSYNERIKNIDELRKRYPDLLRNLNLENATSEEYAGIINNKVIPAMIAQAKAKVVIEELTKAQQNLQKIQEDGISIWDKLTQSQGTSEGSLGKVVTAQERFNQRVKEAQQPVDRLTKLLTGYNEAASQSGDNTNVVTKTLEDFKARTEQRLAIAIKGTKDELEIRQQLLKDNFDIETKNLDRNSEQYKAALVKRAQEEEALNTEFALKGNAIQEQGKLVAINILHNKQLITEREYEESIYQIRLTSLQRQYELYKKDANKQTELLNQEKQITSDRELQRQKESTEDELQAINTRLQKRQESLNAEYELKKQAVEKKRQLQLLNPNLTTEQKTDVNSKADEKNEQDEKEHQIRTLQIIEEGLKTKREAYLKGSEEEYEIQKQILSTQELLDIANATEQIKNAEELSAKLFSIKEKYAADLSKLTTEQNERVLKTNVKLYESEVDLQKSTLSKRKGDAMEIEKDNYERDARVFEREKNLKLTELANNKIGDKEYWTFVNEGQSKLNKEKEELDISTEDRRREIFTTSAEAEIKISDAVSSALKASEESELSRKNLTEQQKKSIVKRYAGYELAINTSKIISSTAVAIANDLALPPPLDAIKATADGIAGAVQEGVAIAQYNRIQGLIKGGIHYNSDGKGAVIHAPGTGIDGANAKLTHGEAVINPVSTRMFLPELSKINSAGGGKKFFAEGGVYTEGDYAARMASQPVQAEAGMINGVTKAISDMPPGVVHVLDIIRGIDKRNIRVDDKVNVLG